MPANELDEQPRYKIINEPVCLNSGVIWPVGSELAVLGWLPGRGANFEPLNESARRIHRYQSARQALYGLPDSPFESKFGRIFLPWTNMFDPSRPDRRALLDTDAPPNMPRYRILSLASDWNHQKFTNGDVIAYAGWPLASLFLEPVDENAQRVAAYFEAFASHPQILSAPFCEFTLDVFLPELPKIVRSLRDGEDIYETHAERAAMLRQASADYRREIGLPAKAPPAAERSSRKLVRAAR